MARDFFHGRHAGLLVPLFSIPSRSSWGIGEIADLLDRSVHRVLDGHHVAVVHDLRMIQALFAGDRHLERHVGAGLQPRQPVVALLLGAELHQ